MQQLAIAVCCHTPLSARKNKRSNLSKATSAPVRRIVVMLSLPTAQNLLFDGPVIRLCSAVSLDNYAHNMYLLSPVSKFHIAARPAKPTCE